MILSSLVFPDCTYLVQNHKYWVHRTSENICFTFDKLTVAKSEKSKFFSHLYIFKKWFRLISLIFNACKPIFEGRYAVQLGRHFPGKEYGIQVLSYLASSSQTEGSLLRTPWPAKPVRIIWQKMSSVNSLKWKNTLNYFWSNAIDKVKNLINLPTKGRICFRFMII